MTGASTYVAVVGGDPADPAALEVAERVGRSLGQRSCILVCGGLGGVMEAACRGAKATGGTTIGILPSLDRASANPYVDIAIPTGMGEMRNALIVRGVDGLIAVGGGFGTLSEIALALKAGKPVIGLDTWPLAAPSSSADPIVRAGDPDEAVEELLSRL